MTSSGPAVSKYTIKNRHDGLARVRGYPQPHQRLSNTAGKTILNVKQKKEQKEQNKQHNGCQNANQTN